MEGCYDVTKNSSAFRRMLGVHPRRSADEARDDDCRLDRSAPAQEPVAFPRWKPASLCSLGSRLESEQTREPHLARRGREWRDGAAHQWRERRVGPALVSDGHQIAFIAERGDDEEAQIYLLSNRGGEAAPRSKAFSTTRSTTRRAGAIRSSCKRMAGPPPRTSSASAGGAATSTCLLPKATWSSNRTIAAAPARETKSSATWWGITSVSPIST